MQIGPAQLGVAVQFVFSLRAFHPLRVLCGLHAIFFSHLHTFSGRKSSAILLRIWPQIFLYGTLTSSFGKVNSYGIQMQSPDPTSICVVTLMENSVAFGVPAKESKITTISKFFLRNYCVFTVL